MLGIVPPLSSWRKALLPPSCREQTETQRDDEIFQLKWNHMILTSHCRQVLRVPFSKSIG